MVSIFHLSCAGTPIGCRWPGPGPSQAQVALTYHNLVNGTKCLNVSLWPQIGTIRIIFRLVAAVLEMSKVTKYEMSHHDTKNCRTMQQMHGSLLPLNQPHTHTHTPLHVWTAGRQQMSRRKRLELNSETRGVEADLMTLNDECLTKLHWHFLRFLWGQEGTMIVATQALWAIFS